MTNINTEQEIESLLPYYVNGSLTEDEIKRVERTLAENENLQQELVFLQKLQIQVQQQKQQNSPGEFGLKRLQRRLKEQQTIDNNSQQQKILSSTKNRWQFAAMAACLMLVVQTVNNIETGNTYQAAGGTAVTQYKGKIVSVTFSPAATEQQIRNLFLETNVFIVDGPSALGIYRLVIVDGSDTTIEKLASQADLIESIQEE
ncbi:MAG: hypothetical protein COA63_009065 [Methylophaga sp.]|nr:hypothetical protein [Methylophaga sp.]